VEAENNQELTLWHFLLGMNPSPTIAERKRQTDPMGTGKANRGNKKMLKCPYGEKSHCVKTRS
jgi:hypothetical protein